MAQIINNINSKSHKKSMAGDTKALSRTKERKEIIKTTGLKTTSSRDSPSTQAIRAALLVLIQHSIVTVTKSLSRNRKTRIVFHYQYWPERARVLLRYPRFVEYTKKALDETAAALVEELLLNGRMTTVYAIVSTVEQLQQLKEANGSTLSSSSRYTYRQAVLESFRRLVAGGFIQQVQKIESPDDEAEHEWSDNMDVAPPPNKKQKISEDADEIEDPTVISLLQSGPYKILARDAVWRVNVEMFHESLRAVSLGWLVAERYGSRVHSSGSIVTAALKLSAYKRHAGNTSQQQDYEAIHFFKTEDITRYLPKTVQQVFEKKAGGLIKNLFMALQDLCHCTNPPVVEEVEVADGQPEHAKFQISTRKLVGYLQDRTIHQMIVDSHGDVAARICSILRTNGHLESDAIAEAAMVPAKDTREVLHRLYRENYIDLFNINQSKQHNPANMFYLWSTSRAKSLRKATDSVCVAMLNMRLRRQHEVEIGKEWIERAKEAGATDENENDIDKMNYTRFCQGLERLDTAALQLDETLMVLKDY